MRLKPVAPVLFLESNEDVEIGGVAVPKETAVFLLTLDAGLQDKHFGSDVVIQNRTGVLHEDLQRATLEALKLDGEGCIAHARRYSWRRSAEAFATLIEPSGSSA